MADFNIWADLNLSKSSLTKSGRQVQSTMNTALSSGTKNLDHFSNSLGRITGQASEFHKSLDAATARVFAFGASMAIINGARQAFSALLNTTIEVESRMTEIRAIFGQTEAQFASFRDSIFKVARDTGQGFKVVGEGAAELARLGLDAEASAKRLEAALVLTNISAVDSAKSVKTLTAVINGFSSAALTDAQIVNKLVAVDTAFAISADDLADGLARAGSTAEDAGISLDEMLGILTAVVQRTGRTGAVVGNAFKSIFPRLTRAGAIEQLKELGVEIDASQTGIQKLRALSDALERISDPIAANKIKEIAGGIRQINIVSSALKDLGQESSVTAQATKLAADANNEAFEKNAEIINTLKGSTNELVIAFTAMGSAVGDIALAPLVNDLAKFATQIADFVKGSLASEGGNVFIKTFVDALSNLGPAIITVATFAFVKLLQLVAKFAKQGLKEILTLGTQSEKTKQIQAGIVDLLQKDKNLREKISGSSLTLVEKEKLIIESISLQNTKLKEQAALLKNITNAARAAGVVNYNPETGRFAGRNRASGYQAEAAMEVIQARALGASPTVKAIRSKGTIGGRKFTMNNQETEIPNFGSNGDSAVIPHYAKGYIPNFAKPSLKGFLARPNVQLDDVLKAVEKGSIRANQVQKPVTVGGVEYQPEAFNKMISEARLKGVAGSKTVKKNTAIDIGKLFRRGDIPTILTPHDAGEKSTSRRTKAFKSANMLFPFDAYKPNYKGADAIFRDNFNKDSLAKSIFQSTILPVAQSLSSVVGGGKINPTNVSQINKYGSLRDKLGKTIGEAFEASVQTAFNSDFKENSSQFQGDFDIRVAKSGKAAQNLQKIFGQNSIPSSGLADFKSNAGSEQLKSMADKMLREPRYSKKIAEAVGISQKEIGTFTQLVSSGKKTLATGYIPNFADPLASAISREKAAGLPMSKIRVNSDSRLANSGNPLGLAVTNTRDEPRGLRDVFAKGFVPNFAKRPNSRKFTSADIDPEVTKLNKLFKARMKENIALLKRGEASQKQVNEARKLLTAELKSAKQDLNRSKNFNIKDTKLPIGQQLPSSAGFDFSSLGQDAEKFVKTPISETLKSGGKSVAKGLSSGLKKVTNVVNGIGRAIKNPIKEFKAAQLRSNTSILTDQKLGQVGNKDLLPFKSGKANEAIKKLSAEYARGAINQKQFNTRLIEASKKVGSNVKNASLISRAGRDYAKALKKSADDIKRNTVRSFRLAQGPASSKPQQSFGQRLSKAGGSAGGSIAVTLGAQFLLGPIFEQLDKGFNSSAKEAQSLINQIENLDTVLNSSSASAEEKAKAEKERERLTKQLTGVSAKAEGTSDAFAKAESAAFSAILFGGPLLKGAGKLTQKYEKFNQIATRAANIQSKGQASRLKVLAAEGSLLKKRLGFAKAGSTVKGGAVGAKGGAIALAIGTAIGAAIYKFGAKPFIDEANEAAGELLESGAEKDLLSTSTRALQAIDKSILGVRAGAEGSRKLADAKTFDDLKRTLTLDKTTGEEAAALEKVEKAQAAIEKAALADDSTGVGKAQDEYRQALTELTQVTSSEAREQRAILLQKQQIARQIAVQEGAVGRSLESLAKNLENSVRFTKRTTSLLAAVSESQSSKTAQTILSAREGGAKIGAQEAQFRSQFLLNEDLQGFKAASGAEAGAFKNLDQEVKTAFEQGGPALAKNLLAQKLEINVSDPETNKKLNGFVDALNSNLEGQKDTIGQTQITLLKRISDLNAESNRIAAENVQKAVDLPTKLAAIVKGEGQTSIEQISNALDALKGLKKGDISGAAKILRDQDVDVTKLTGSGKAAFEEALKSIFPDGGSASEISQKVTNRLKRFDLQDDLIQIQKELEQQLGAGAVRRLGFDKAIETVWQSASPEMAQAAIEQLVTGIEGLSPSRTTEGLKTRATALGVKGRDLLTTGEDQDLTTKNIEDINAQQEAVKESLKNFQQAYINVTPEAAQQAAFVSAFVDASNETRTFADSMKKLHENFEAIASAGGEGATLKSVLTQMQADIAALSDK